MRVPVRRLNVTVGRIGNGVQIPDRTAAVMPSDAQYAIGANPRRPRGAMRLSQKTCPRSVYRFFGLKRDMFLVRARLRVFRQRAALALLCSCGIYRFLADISRFFMCLPGKPLFSRYRAPLKNTHHRRAAEFQPSSTGKNLDCPPGSLRLLPVKPD